MTTPPVLARVLRGDQVESCHRGDVAIREDSGRFLAAAGDASRPIFLRSAAKPFQALPFLEAGGAERFRLSGRELALICASHGGEPRHVRTVERLLNRGGFRIRDLVCGPHLPSHEPSARALLARGERPTRLHNNCSGKHAGLLLACRLLRLPTRSYWRPDHPLQLAIRRRIAELGSFPEDEMEVAIDGCGLAVYRLPLSALALAYARLMARRVHGETRAEKRARAQVVEAMSSYPDMVAGTRFFTTELLKAGRGRWIGKEGAEGVYAVGVRASASGGRAAGIALKIEDGSARARPAVTLALMREMRWLPESARRALCAFASPPVQNAAGAVVGSIEPQVPIIRRDAGE
ncbi:MAG TPA: asparaginase [Thermoanaerobaculia bacterium]|jgi:L-asparaginase II